MFGAGQVYAIGMRSFFSPSFPFRYWPTVAATAD